MSPLIYDQTDSLDRQVRQEYMATRSAASEMDDAIAIVGLSIEFPSAQSPAEFWDLLVSGKCAAKPFPAERFNHETWHSHDGSTQGTIAPKKSYFLEENIAAFDAQFFSTTAAEAEAMDPQQRRLLEVTYRALENGAGIPVSEVHGTNTAVFTGYFTNDYLMLTGKDPELIPKYSSTGTAGSMLSNRISTYFDLRGPSVTIDTACSSSLVALDMACQSIRHGESSMGIVAGCNLMFLPDLTVGLSSMGFLSPDGVCYSFDQRAGGYARGEGFGVLILKPLPLAIQSGDTIRAVIRATKTNQNGSTSLCQPSQEAQVQLIRETYTAAGLDMSSTRFVEAHGTGTPVGDPTEAAAIGEAFAGARSSANQPSPIYIGSSKANIGHLEGTSGIAGVVKAILVLEHGVIPPIANLEKLNPTIDAEFLNLQFPQDCIPWPTTGLRRASVNSFGFGGTNSHAVLDDAYHFLHELGLDGRHCTVVPPTSLSPPGRCSSRTLSTPHINGSGPAPPRVFVWSAADEQGLSRLAHAYHSFFATLEEDGTPAEYLSDVAYTLSERRSRLPWRSFAVASSLQELLRSTASLPPPIHANPDRQLGLIFTGQGAQWCGMGRELFTYPKFRQSVLEATAYFQELGCREHLADFIRMSKSDPAIHDPAISQPVCTLLQVALVDLLVSWDVSPVAVVGHSSGEIAAAYAVGALSRDSAWRLAYYRGALSSDLARRKPEAGSMIAVALSEETVDSYMKRVKRAAHTNSLWVACINSPNNVTISGARTAVHELKVLLDHDNVFNRILPIPVAYHSPQMLEISAAYAESVGRIGPGDGGGGFKKARMVSSVTAKLVSTEDLRKTSYWVQNLVSPVRFAAAIQICCCSTTAGFVAKKLDLSHRNALHLSDLLEIGPHSTLQGPLRETLAAASRSQVSYMSSLVRRQPAMDTLMAAVGLMHSSGHHVNLLKVNTQMISSKPQGFTLPNLPEYVFNHSKTYWHESRLAKNSRFRRHGLNNFLGTPIADWNPVEPRWRHFLSSSKSSTLGWIRDHKINGDVLFPAAGMLVMALEAVIQISREADRDVTAFEITEAEFISSLPVPSGDELAEAQIRLTQETDSKRLDPAYEFHIYAHREDTAIRISRGFVKAICIQRSNSDVDNGLESREVTRDILRRVEGLRSKATKETKGPALYNRLHKLGYHFGDSFRRIRHVSYDDGSQAVGELSVYDDLAASPSLIHPATLDGIMQLILPAVTTVGNKTSPTMIPTRLDRLWIAKDDRLWTSPTSRIRAYTTRQKTTNRSLESSIHVLSRDDASISMRAEGIEVTTVAEPASYHDLHDARRLCSELIWKPDHSMMTPESLQQTLCLRRSKVPDPLELLHDIRSYVMRLMYQVSRQVNTIDTPTESPHLARQLAWIKRHLPSKFNDKRPLHELGRCLQKYGEVGKTYTALGARLKDILTGICDPLEVLSQENVLRGFYDFAGSTWKFVEALQFYVGLLCHKNPAMKIMEVGAGTGSTTRHLFQSLVSSSSDGFSARYSRFDFTDVSLSFLAKAKEDFSRYPKISFGLFDMQNNPAAQGYELGTYDVIVAANVLHVAKCLDDALLHLRKALKKGGKLILIEITEPDSVMAAIIFGCLPGWWQSTDTYRQGSPCLSEKSWNQALLRNGFSGTDVVLRDYDHDQIHLVSLMISTATEAGSIIPPDHPPMRIVTGFDPKAATPFSKMANDQLGGRAQVGTFFDALNDEKLSDQLVVMMHGPEWPCLDSLDEKEYHAFHSVLMGMKAGIWAYEKPRSLGICPHPTLVTGLARTLRVERNGLIFTTLILDQGPKDVQRRQFTTALQNTLDGLNGASSYEPELAIDHGLLEIPRVYENDNLNQAVFAATCPQEQLTPFGAKNLNLRIRSPGLLETLYFEELESDVQPLEDDELEVEVKAVGVNFKDVLVALGHVQDSTFGTECSGVVLRSGSACHSKPGDLVMVGHLDVVRRSIRCRQLAVEAIPVGLSLAEAAAIPTNFLTAYRALVEIAQIAPEETVLIHAGAGGTGQAAIQIAQHCGAKVFVTVGSDTKKRLLQELYDIPVDQILYSRDLSFVDGIKRLTNGRGVDVVLNSLAGPSLMAAWESILAPWGRFIEIGNKDIMSRRQLPMMPFAHNATFSAIDMVAMMKHRPKLVSKAMKALVKLFNDGALRPVSPLQTFPISKVEEAFRHLQTGKASGKVVLEIEPEIQVPAMLTAETGWRFDAHSTFVVAGGLGNQGRSIAQWMTLKGARHLVLLSRQGPSNSAAKAFLDQLRGAGVDVFAPPCDITDATTVQAMVNHCKGHMPPIRGCIQSSAVFKDVMFSKTTRAEWNAVLRPKVRGSWNLHKLLPRDLDFFIFLSSVMGVIGSLGQANYVAGNVFEDVLARSLNASGRNVTSINMSAMESVGALVDNPDFFDQLLRLKQLMPMSQHELFAIIEQCLQGFPSRGQVVTGLELPSAVAAKGDSEPVWMSQPMFNHLHQLSTTTSSSLKDQEDDREMHDLASLVEAGKTTDEIAAILAPVIASKLSKFLSIPTAEVDVARPLQSYGVDSLIAMELRNWLLRALKAEVSVFEILGGSSVQTLSRTVASKPSVRAR